MNVTVHDGSLPTSQALSRRITARIGKAFKHAAWRVGQVHVWIADMNAGKRGVDKRCRIVANIAHASPIVVEQRDTDYYRAIDGATAKLRQAAAHRLTRH